MKLLIVDDQPGVTEGLCHGVNWAQLGFSQVQAVNSVREARAAMLNTVTDVILSALFRISTSPRKKPAWSCSSGSRSRALPPGAFF